MLDMDVYTDKNGIPRTTIKLDVDDIDFIRTSEMPAKTGDADDGAFVNAPTAGMMAVTDPACPF